MATSLPRPKSVIFDLDGTLINSAPDIAEAVNKTIASMGYEALSVDYVEQFIGNGSRDLIEQILIDLQVDYDHATIDEKLAEYKQHYSNNPATKTHFFPYVKEDLKALKDAGLTLGICTNKPHKLTALVLKELGIDDYFQCFYGADAVEHSKPHANHLQTVMQDMGVDYTTTFYVGDTEVDRKCAHSAQTPFFIVPWGGGAHIPQGSDYTINRLSDLLNYFE